MLGFIIQRFLQAVVVMAVMTVIVFCGVYAIGNPIDIVIPPEATQDIRDEVIRRLGLDRPLYEQYFIFMSNLLQGDLGRSFVYNIPVLELIGGRLPATLELVLISVISATVLGVSLGIYAGYRPDSWLSKAIMAISVLGFSVPSFWVGLILILFFAVNLGWLPAGGRGWASGPGRARPPHSLARPATTPPGPAALRTLLMMYKKYSISGVPLPRRPPGPSAGRGLRRTRSRWGEGQCPEVLYEEFLDV